MKILEAFRGSLALMRKAPKVFVPRLTTTSVYTIFVLYSARLSIDLALALGRGMFLSQQLGIPPDYGGLVAPYFGGIFLLIAFSLGVFVMDVVSYGMYPRIVADYRSCGKVSLTAALCSALRRWRVLVAFGFIVLLILFFLLAVGSVLQMLAFATGKLLFLLAAVVFLLTAVLVFGILFFFVIPVAVIEEKDGIKSVLAESVSLSLKHRTPLLKINVVFITLSLATMAVATLTEFKGAVAYTALALFILGRLVQAMVYTYISVVNPYFYLILLEKTGRNP